MSVRVLPPLLISAMFAVANLAGAAALTVPQPLPVDCPHPRWPKIALMNLYTGAVTLEFDIGPDGKVTEARLQKSSGFRELDVAGLEAIRSCRFKPTYVDGVAVTATANRQFVFSFDRLDTPPPFLAAAKEGEAESQYLMGEVHRTSRIDKADLEDAAEWYLKAANQGHPAAQYMLAMLYTAGTGVSRSADDARAWMIKAANSGNADAQNQVGAMYEDGKGVPQDMAVAAAWYGKAAAQGHVVGQYNLSQCLELGLGLAPDPVAAAAWYSKAGAQGDMLAQQALVRLTAKPR